MRKLIQVFALVGLLGYQLSYAQSIPSPKEHFGFNIGDDYHLSNYTQTEAYFKKLATSDRVKLVDIGLTEEGRHQYMMIVTSPENHKKLARFQEISTKLARAEGLTDAQAKAMAEEGKAVVEIEIGLAACGEGPERLVEHHVVPADVRDAHPGAIGVIDEHLAARQARRRIAVRASHFGLIPLMVSQSLLVLTTGRLFCSRYTDTLPVRVVRCPVAFPPLAYYQLWHDLTHQAPAMRWFREQVREVARQLPTRQLPVRPLPARATAA